MVKNPFFDVDMTKMMDMSKMVDMSKLLDMSKAMADLKVQGVDLEAVVASQRKNLEALTAANQAAVEGIQTVARRQGEIMRQAMEATSEAMKELMTMGSPGDKAAKQTELAKTAFERAIANMRELAELVTKSNTDAFDIINKRVTASLDELKAAIGKKQGGA